ncbi:MAG: LUD domain-containing protein [Bacteroidetes bacterium]|nr:LUD domain-containing protein [Bacteroidota bacterium]
MEESTSKEKVLKKIRDALIEKTEPPYPIIDMEAPLYVPMTESLDVTFATELVKVSGKFGYYESEDEFLTFLQTYILEQDWPVIYCYDYQLQNLLRQGGIPFESDPEKLTDMKLGITRCEYLVARLGTVMVSSRVSPGRKMSVFPETHLVVAYTSQLVPDLKDAFRNLRKKYEDDFPSVITLVTGPSRTADIEKTLVLGAHGPKELYVFLIEDRVQEHE